MNISWTQNFMLAFWHKDCGQLWRGNPQNKQMAKLNCTWSTIYFDGIEYITLKSWNFNSFQNDNSLGMDLRCGKSIWWGMARWRTFLAVSATFSWAGWTSWGPALYWPGQLTLWSKWTSGPKKVSLLFHENERKKQAHAFPCGYATHLENMHRI